MPHRRVVWSKGMFLAPEHFQARDRFSAEELRFRGFAARYANWGLTELMIDETALEDYKIGILRCAGVMPDGLAFRFGGPEQPPESARFEKAFGPEVDELNVYLTVPDDQSGGLNVSRSEKSGLRYVAADMAVANENEADKGEEQIEVARPNFHLALGAQAPNGATVLQIGQITKLGGLQMNPEFIAPCLHIGVSEHLMDRLIPSLLNSLKLVSAKLSGTRGEQAEYLADFAESDIRRFWVLDLVNRTLPEINHLYLISSPRKLDSTQRTDIGSGFPYFDEDDFQPETFEGEPKEARRRPRRPSRSRTGAHPEELYRLLLRLAGGLCTFSTEMKPLDFPRYDHRNLGKCFSELVDAIESMLKSIVYPPSRFGVIPLTALGSGEWGGPVEKSYFRIGRFYLALRLNSGNVDLVRFAEIEKKVKICGVTVYPDVRDRALEGARLQHERRPPRGLPGRFGGEFFRILPGSLEWKDVEETGQIRLLVTPSPTEPNPDAFVVEVFALLE